jgi:hypothetical protein
MVVSSQLIDRDDADDQATPRHSAGKPDGKLPLTGMPVPVLSEGDGS